MQSQGQGLVPYGSKLDSANPTGTGSLSLNKASGSTLGTNAVALGTDNTASGNHSFAEGYHNVASNAMAHVEGRECTTSGAYSHGEGYKTTSSGSYGAHSEGDSTVAGGDSSHAEGQGTKTSRRSQHVVGEFNIEDTTGANSAARGSYVEVVGNGTSNSARSNARTLDWSGNEVLAGGLKINGNQDVHGISVSADRVRFNSTTTLTYTGYSISCPTGHTYLCSVLLFFANSSPKEIAISYSSTSIDLYNLIFRSDACSCANFILKGGQTAYVWGRFGSESNNGLDYIIVDIAP